MLLRQIRYFVTAVECSSFTEAAELPRMPAGRSL